VKAEDSTCFGRGVGAAAEALIQGAAPGDMVESGQRSPMAPQCHLAQLPIPNQPRPHPLLMQRTALCALCQKQEEMGGKKSQQSNSDGKSSVLQGCCGGGWRQHPAHAHGFSRSACHLESPFSNS